MANGKRAAAWEHAFQIAVANSGNTEEFKKTHPYHSELD